MLTFVGANFSNSHRYLICTFTICNLKLTHSPFLAKLYIFYILLYFLLHERHE